MAWRRSSPRPTTFSTNVPRKRDGFPPKRYPAKPQRPRAMEKRGPAPKHAAAKRFGRRQMQSQTGGPTTGRRETGMTDGRSRECERGFTRKMC